MKKIVLVFIISLYVNFGFTQSQQKTAYQKKIESLTIKFFKDLGVSYSQLEQFSKAGEIEGLFLVGSVMQKMNTEKGILLMFKWERECREASVLKTEVDFKREKKEAEEKEKKKQEEARKIEEQQKIQEIKENEERLKKEYENSDFVQMKNTIKEEVKEWIDKGEFEKSEDYNHRIVNESKNKIDEIIFSNAKEYFNRYNNQIKCSLLSYNADLEIFPIETKYKNNVWTNNLSIPINNAEKFKSEFWKFDVKIEDEDWQLIENNWIPLKFNLTNRNSNNSFIITLAEYNNQYDFQLDSKELEIYNIINDYKFSWLSYTEDRRKIALEKAEIEKKRLEKIEKDKIEAERVKQEELKRQEELRKIQEAQKLEQLELERKFADLNDKHIKINQTITDKFNSKEFNSKKGILVLEKFTELNNAYVDQINETNNIKIKIQKFIDLQFFENYMINLIDKKQIKSLADILENTKDTNDIEKVFRYNN